MTFGFDGIEQKSETTIEFEKFPHKGQKLQVWNELKTPATTNRLRHIMNDIPYDSLRRCLSEMHRDGFIVMNPTTKKWFKVEKYT